MATIQEAYQAACNAGFIKRNEFSEEAFGNMLQNDNNRRAYYDHVTKIDPTFYSKDYDTFSQNVLSALGQPAAKNSTNQPSNAAPAPSQVQPTFQPAQGQPTFWQSIGAHDPYPQKTAEGVTQFEKEQQLQRESAATMPLSQQDKDRQAEIQRLQTEGTWGKPNGITMDIDKQTGLPTINQTEGDGMHLSIGATLPNQDEIDRLKAEQPSYITREIKTPQDLYTSVSEAWAANTPDGQKAKAELDKTAQDTYNNLLADMNRQIADLQQQVNNGTVTQQQAQQEAQRIADNTNAVYENEMQLAQDYFFRQMTDANADYLSQQARLLGQKATNQTISDINARIAPHIRQLETERQQAMQRASQSVQAQGGMYGAIGASISANTAYKPEKDQELALYHQSQQFLADAAKISDAAQKGEGFWKGLGKSLGDIDTWDFGISQLTRSANLKDIVEKYERGEQLTDAEKGLMDSAVAYMSACAYNSDKINRRYKMGQTTGESIPFMLQFMVMPIGAIKDKVAKGVLGYGIEQFGGKAAQATGKAAAKYGAKTAFKEAGTALLGNLAAAGVQTAAFGVPKIAEGAISRMTGDIQPTLDEQGNIAYNGRRNQQSAASAVWNSAVDMYAENLSEMILTSLDPLKAYAGTAKLFSGLKNSQIAQVLGRLNEGVIGKVRDRVQFRNYLEEVGEEYVGNLIRWGLSTDVNNAEDAGFSADQQIDTWLGLAPTSIAFVGAGAINSAVSGGIDRFQSSRAAKRLREIMADGDKRRYLESLLKSRNSDDFSKNAHEVIKSVLRDKELNEDTKRLIMDGIYSTYQSQLAQEAEQARTQAEAERQAQPEQPETANVSDSAQPQTQAQVQVNTEGEEHYQDADGNEVTFYRNADGSVTLRDKNGNAAVDEQGNAVTLTQTEFDQYARDTNLRRVDRELTPEQWAERENQLRQQYEAEVQPNTHNDGNVYEVVLASDVDKRGYIVGDGKVEIDNTTDPAVPRITNADVVTVRYEDGTMAQVAAKDLNLVEVDSAEQIVEDNLQPFQQYAQAMQTFRTGQEVTMDDGSGKTYTSRVVSVSEDGVEVEIEDQLGNPTTWTFDNATALTALQPVEQAQPAVDIANPKPIGTNKFGTIYQWVVGKAKEAAQFLFHNRNSYLKGVFHRDDIGDIDLVWGNDKAGFQHIIKRHILEQTDFGSINDAIEAISKTIQNGRIVSENDSQCTIDDGTYRVAIAKDGTGNWVVTAYDNSRGKVEKQRGNTNSPLVVPSTEQNNPSDVAFSHQENGDTSMSNLFSGKDTTNNSDTQVPAPNIDTMSPEELGASAVEFMGGVADGKAYLEAERDKADTEVKRLAKQKINKYTDAADFKRQNDELKKARTEAASRFNKLEQALITANNYKTQKEKERSRIQRLLKNGKLAYINKATLPPASDKTIQGDQLTNPVGEELSSADKGTKNIPNSQTPEQKSAENLPNASQDEQSHTEEVPKDEQSKDNGGKEQSQSQQSENKIFTEDAYEAARRRMHERLNRLNAGLDPEMLSDGLIMAGYHVEKGARKFAEFAREMIREFGDKIRPYLKSFYNGLRDLPEAVDLSKEMDDYSTVMQFDVNSISIERAKETKKTSDILPSAGESVTLQPKKVDVEGLFGALNTKGEAKLSDHIEQESLSSANAEDTQPIGNVIQSKHTKTGEDIWIVKPSERVSDDEFKLLKARAKANNGYYSSFAKNRGFIFKSKEDANNFNNISDEEITTDQTSADTETAVRTAETVVGETATITRDRRDSNRAEGESGTESIEGGVREPRNVELTPEQANEQVTTRQQAIAKIDNANDKITDQLAVLGFYEADTSDPTKFHESYGYIKTAEAKAVKDIDRLAKQLADDLGIKVSKRKTIAKANIAPAGGDISFRLPLENGKELYLSVDIEPNYELNEMPYRDVSEDSLTVDGIMWRIEDPQASGMARYSLNNQYCKESIKYIDLLNDIRRKSKEYLPTILAGTTKQEIAKQVAEKAIRKKKDTTRIADAQPMLDLFGDVVDTMNEGAHQEHDEPERKFVNAVSRHLLGALVSEDMQTPFRSILDLRKLAKESGIEVDDNGKTDILLQELVEDGLVRAARQLVASGKYGDAKSKATYDAIVHLYEIQPTIAQRSSNRIAMQQYSTPLPMAFVADMFAYEPNMRSILEPTAGNGMLVFAVPAEKVHANELDETRLANLHLQEFQEVTSQDATEPFGGGKRYDAIIANPPFGSREEREYDGKMIAGLDPQITLNALASMKDSGKAAIIIGGNMEYADNGSVKDKKAFWSYLYDHYNVKGVVDIDGQLYRKQGTTYPTRMILIDGRRSEAEREQTTIYPPIQQKAIAKVNTFDDLYNTIAEITNSNKKTNGTEILRTAGGSSSVSDSNNTSGNTGVLGHSGKHSADDGNGRDGGQRPTDSTGSAGGNRPNDEGGVSPTSGASGRKVSGHSMGGVLRPQEPVHGLNTTSNDGSFARPERTTTDGERSGKNNVGRSGRVPVDGIRELGTSGDRVGLKPQQKRNLTEEKLPYRPHNTAFSLQSVAPAAMVEAMDNTLSQIEQSVGKSIDQFVTDELGYDTIQDAHNALAAEQMDSVAMAIYQMQKGQALIIGDQTGVGKGRQMAALIRWAVRQGKKPIFITQKADLFSDIYRDLVDIGSGDLRPFIFNSATAKDGKGIVVDANGNEIYKALSDEKTKLICLQSNELPDGFDYVLATYSQFNSGDNVSRKAGVKKKKELDEDKVAKATFLRKLSRDNYLFLDESHTAAGESNTGTFFQSIIGEKGEDGVRAVTFASATFAKRPDTMPMYALRTAMAEANVEREKLIGIIEKGGVTLQEIMSRALTESGQMVRRERDMTDVKTDWKTIDDPATTKRAREQYDRTIVAFNAIIDFQDKFITPLVKEQDRELAEVMSTANLKKGTKKFGVDNTPFASKTFNYTKQLMLALKVDAIVDEVEREIKAGRHPVIALESTMESTIKDYTPGETIAEPSFSASLLKGLDNCMQYTVKDDRSKETHMTYTPNELGEEGETAYYKLQDFIRESTKDIFISPLDAIIERLHEKGYRVGELTGRNTYVERTDDGKIVVRRRTDKDKKRMQREFNSGALDVLILNKSASTGISLHASEKFSDKRQRSMIIAQPLSDINDYMQMIGRIDRTGQVHRGYYINLGLPVPAESRFLMMLSTKLKSLNANTTTSQDSESNEVDAPDLLNKYGSQVVIEYLRDNPTIYEKIGEPLKKNSKKGDDKIIHANELDEYTPSEDDALKITGRVALLNTKEQEEFYNDVVRRYNDLIRYLNDTGTNDLKITTLPLRAKTISRKVSSVGREPNGNNPFAGNAYVEQVEMDVLRKPMKANEVQKLIVQLNGTSDRAAGRKRVKDIMSIVERETEDKMTLENERYENAKQKAALTLEEYARKINANEKMSSEQKATTIEQKQQETEQKLADKNRDNILSIQHKAAYLNRMLDMFTVGETYLVPDDLGSAMFSSSTHSIFCGYKVKDNKISASTSFAVFATLDGRRKVEIKLSDISILNRINDHTNQNWDAAQQTTLDNWDKQIPTQTRKEGYIMTGNILQAVADTQDEYGNYTGQLISYTDIDGNIHDGILMPDKWKTSQLRGGVPISARLEQMKQGTVVSTDGKVTIRRGWGAPDVYFLIVPKSKSEGGKYFLNPDILRLVEGNNFYTVRGHMQAEVPAQNIEAVLGILSDMGVKAQDSTIEAQYDELDYDTDNLTDAQQFDTDVLLGALDEAGISVERVSEEDAERELNSRQILEKSQKSTTFVPTSKVPKSELAVAHKALFAKVQDQSEAGIVYGVFSANYYHIFNGNQHQYAVRIEGNEDIISDIQKEIQYGTNKNANPLSQWVTDIQSGKGYDSRDNANATEQRGGDVDANALYGRQPTDSQRDNQESNGDSGITTPLRTTSGVIHGYAKDGKIYLTDKGFNPNTPIHEYTHLWVKAVRNNNAELYGNLRDLFSRENLPDMWNELDNDPQYRDLSDEAKLSEIIARFSGKRGAERMEQETQKLIDDAKQEGKRAVADAVSLRERMRNLLRRFWNWVGEHLFHIKHFGSREEAADRVLYDLLNATDLRQPPAEKDSQAEFSTSPMPKRMDGEMVHEWAKRIAEWKRQQVDEQQVAEYAKLLDQNNSKKSRAFAYVVDKFTPIDNFQQWVQAQGGVYNHDTMDMYSDISLALGRIETYSRRYKNDYMQRIADSIAQIAKDNHIADPLLALGLKWQNFDNKKMNGKPLTVREIMGVYAQAKDTWEADQQGLSDRGAQGFVKNLGVSHTDIIEAVERIIPQKQLDEFWNAVYAANQFALDYQLNAGMLDTDTRNRYTRRYYVPQRGWRERDFDGKDTAYIKGNGTRLYGNPYNAALVKAHGRESLASDPFALIESIGLTSITQSEHNKSKQQLLNLLLANEMLGLKSGAWRVKQVWSKNVIDPRTGHIMHKPDGTPMQAEVTYAAPTQQEREHDADINSQIEQLRKELRDLTQPTARAKREAEIANLQDQLIYTGRATDTMLEHRTRDERLQHQIIVLYDGQQYVIELQDERLANAVNGNFGEAVKAYALFNKYNAPAIRYISGVLTQYNPRFAHRNFWRDAQAAFLNNLSEQGAAFTTRAMANIPMVQRTVWKYILADTYKGKEKYTGQFGDYLREYFEAGAQTGFSFMPELERMAKDFNKMVKGENAWDKVWGKGVKGTLSLMTEASELTVRFAEYVTARQMGRSVQEAAKLAKNISVNFNQSGLMSKEMSKFFTFFNATVQGNMRFLMPYGKNKPKFGERAFKFGAKFAGMAANLALLGLLSTFLQPDNPDDDTWFTEYDRMSNFILFGKVKIPIVHFFRMFYAAGVQAALAAQGRKTWKDAFYTSADYALGELVPASALQVQNLWDYDKTTNTIELNPAKYAQAAAPSVISPLVDVAVNRDFKGSTVYRKKWDNDKKDITTAKRNTPQWAVDVSNTLHRWSGGNPDVPYKGGNTDGWIDIKPNAIEHLAQGYLSGAWEGLGHTAGFIWDGAHDADVFKHATNWPFLRDLFRDYSEEKAYNQQYYSVLQKLEKYEKRVNTLPKEKFNAEKQTNRFRTFKQVSKQLRRLPNPYDDEEATVTSEDVNKILQLDIKLNRNLFAD